jgi:hypothetical protein
MTNFLVNRTASLPIIMRHYHIIVHNLNSTTFGVVFFYYIKFSITKILNDML